MKTTPTSRKRGRKSEHYTTTWGDPIKGLARRPADGRWRVIGTDITFTEPDERLAIHKYFTRYVLPSAAATVKLVVPRPEKNSRPEEMPVLTTLDYSTPGGCTATQHIAEGAFWSRVREEILARPQYVAQMTGIEQVGYLAELPKPTPSPTLEEVGKLYLDHAKISENWRAKCKLFWKEFHDCVEVSTLRQLTQEHVVGYADVIQEAAQTPTYAQRFGAIKAMLNYPTKRGKWAEDAKRTLALCSVLVPPKKSATDPNPISREAFHALYTAADDQMRAMLLLALNCCMYGGEVAALHWGDINLETGTLNSHRSKTGIVRIAVLWDRTVAALRDFPHQSDAIFITAGTKIQHNYQTFYKSFKALRKASGCPSLQFSQIRDGAYTSAVEAGADLTACRLLAGHATGISDHYVKRRPQMVAAPCAGIEKAYFG